jgi:hypothetical protein
VAFYTLSTVGIRAAFVLSIAKSKQTEKKQNPKALLAKLWCGKVEIRN